MSTDNYNKLENVISVKTIRSVKSLDLRKQRVAGGICEFSKIYYVEQGASVVFVDGKQFSLDEGNMIIYGPGAYCGKSPYYNPGGIVKEIHFEVDSSVMGSIYNRPFRLNLHQRMHFGKLITKGQLLFESITNSSGDERMQFIENVDPRDIQQLKNQLELFLLDISYKIEKKKPLANNSPKNQTYQQQMDKLTDYLMKRINQNPTIKEIQSELFVSESTLRRIVKKSKGCGVIAYFQELKLREAKKLIISTSLSVTEVSNHLGFYSVAYFSAWFKRKTGVSPTEYAKTSRNIPD